jgi:hypothetical protein
MMELSDAAPLAAGRHIPVTPFSGTSLLLVNRAPGSKDKKVILFLERTTGIELNPHRFTLYQPVLSN